MNVSKGIFSRTCRLLTRISPTLNNQFVNLVFHHGFLNLRTPKTFREKLVWLKLNRYIYDPLVKQCADKYAVREYIEKKGLDYILVPLIASYDSIEDIQWDVLPQQFALKLNFGCGYNIISTDKQMLDFHEVKSRLLKWSKEKQYLNKAELQYKGVPLKIIVEQYLKPMKGTLPADYKVYCFNGNPRAILYMVDRGENTKAFFFDENWNYISEPINIKGRYGHLDTLPEKPKCLDDMLDCSKTLSQPFPFVRIDYYVVNDKLYFGEMTFTPSAGLFASECLVDGKPMGDILDIRNTKND